MTMSEEIAAGFRQVAADQIAQDIDNNAKFALKSEIGGSSADHAVLVEQIIGLYNGYNGTALDYRNYLDATEDELLSALYDFGNAYQGVS